MYEAVSEKTGSRLTGFFYEDELLEAVDAASIPGDFWDVYTPSSGNAIAYYYTKED